MSLIIEALTRMEFTLQSMIEGNLARLFPEKGERQNFISQFSSALKTELKSDSSGEIHAPAVIILHTNSENTETIKKYPGILEEISERIEFAALEAGIQFNTPPTLQVRSDPEIIGESFRFEFEHQQKHPGTTAILPAAPGSRGAAIPRNAYLIVSGNQTYPLSKPVTNLGRRTDNDVVIDDRRVSRHHAQIRATQQAITLFDLQSSGGTFVNGKRIRQIQLKPGDVISLAGVKLVFGEDIPQELGKTQKLRPEKHE